MKRLKRSISYVKISFIVHVTEKPQKAIKAARNIVPKQYSNEISFTRNNLWGHHKNPIILFRTTIRNKDIINAFIKNLSNELEETDKEALSLDMKRRMDDKKIFYLRLDKQMAYLGEIKLGDIDPIHIKIKCNFYPKRFEEIINPTNST